MIEALGANIREYFGKSKRPTPAPFIVPIFWFKTRGVMHRAGHLLLLLYWAVILNVYRMKNAILVCHQVNLTWVRLYFNRSSKGVLGANYFNIKNGLKELLELRCRTANPKRQALRILCSSKSSQCLLPS